MDPDPDISIQITCEAWRRDVADAEDRCCLAVREALREAGGPVGEVSVVLTDDHEIQTLNRTFRGRDEPTDVLAFEAGGTPDGVLDHDAPNILGDVVVAHGTALGEKSRKHRVSPADHLSHLVVHGTLHLLGYDHQNDDDARIMEALEVEVLSRLGIADPYYDDETTALPGE